MKRSVPWQPPPWFVTFQAKLRFIREAQQVVDGPVTVVKPSRKLPRRLRGVVRRHAARGSVQDSAR